jgi:hypothetical protein
MNFIKDDFTGMIQLVKTREKGKCGDDGKRNPPRGALCIGRTRPRARVLRRA